MTKLMIYLDDTPMGKLLEHLVKDKESVQEIPAKSDMKSFLGSNYADMAIVVGYFKPNLPDTRGYCPPFTYYPTYPVKDVAHEEKEGYTNWYYVYLTLLSEGLLEQGSEQYLSLFVNYNNSVWAKDLNEQCLAMQDVHMVNTYIDLLGTDNLPYSVDVLEYIKETIYSSQENTSLILQNVLANDAEYRAKAIRKASSALCEGILVTVIHADSMMNLCGLELQAEYYNQKKKSITFVQNGGFCLAFANEDTKHVLDSLAIEDIANTSNRYSFYMHGLEDRRLVLAISEEMG